MSLFSRKITNKGGKVKMRKKLLQTLLIFSLAIGGFFTFSIDNASAADYTSGSCVAKQHTDYYTYYNPSARTIDAWASQNGSCGTLYYKMEIKDQWGHRQSPEVHYGYFNTQTPVKKFDITKVNRYKDPTGRYSEAYMVEITLYSDAARTKVRGIANKNIRIVW